jgi:hypothetical protein
LAFFNPSFVSHVNPSLFAKAPAIPCQFLFFGMKQKKKKQRSKGEQIRYMKINIDHNDASRDVRL